MRWHEHVTERPTIVIEPTPRRLEIYGGYQVELRPWTNPLPASAISGDALANYWRRLVSAATGELHQRARMSDELAAAEKRGDTVLTTTVMQARYANKIETKTLFSIVVCLHRVLVPTARYVCDADCPHMRQGATPEEAKRYLDALDAAHAHEVKSCEGSSNWEVNEDSREQQYLYGRWRGGFAALLDPSVAQTPPLPPPESELWLPHLRKVAKR